MVLMKPLVVAIRSSRFQEMLFLETLVCHMEAMIELNKVSLQRYLKIIYSSKESLKVPK